MDAVEDIKQRLNIEDVVGEYVELKRAGRNLKGLSPFSSERTPSFIVSPEKQIWHDFSSGKGGNMFSFVMEMEGLDFRGALELLARKAGVDLELYRGARASTRGKEKERLYVLLETAATFYQKQLNANHDALTYVRNQRQFSKETQLEWRLGYSPTGGTSLVDYLKAKRFSEKEMKAAGLATLRYRGAFDMFRGRIMVPLADQQGRIIGFTARLLVDDPDAPKYINTPQTPLYDKSSHIFGLHLAKEAIRKSGFAVIAEGNLDVISSHQAGIRQVVATAGTALTPQQLKTLGRFTGDIRLSFDADAAGVQATERAIPLAAKANVSLQIVAIPEGKDPDDLIKKDPGLWRTVIDKPQYAIDWLMDMYRRNLDLTSGDGKKKFTEIILPVIRSLGEPVEAEHYLRKLSDMAGVSSEVLKMRSRSMHTKKQVLKQPKTPPAPAATQEYVKTEHKLLAILLARAESRDIAEPLTADMILEERGKMVLLEIKRDQNRDITIEDFLPPLDEYVTMLLLQYDELYRDVELNELQFEAKRLRSQLIRHYINTQKPLLDTTIDQAIRVGATDSPEYLAVHKKIMHLQELLTKYTKP